MTLEEIKETKSWVKNCTSILLDPKNPNPFPTPPFATNFYNNPPQFCLGREKYEQELLKAILKSMESPQPQLIRIMGKQGIGKSTLICWSAKKLSEMHPVPIIYMETSAQSEDFNMRSLYRQMIDKMEKSGFSEQLLINSIKKFFTISKENQTLYKQLIEQFSNETIEKLIEDSNFIKNKIFEEEFNSLLLKVVNGNAIMLTKFLPFDLAILLIFWKAHVQNPDALKALNAFKGTANFDGYTVETDNDASKYIDALLEFIRWAFDETTTTIIIFDHLEAGISQDKEAVFSNLFSLLLNLRQKKYLTIILSGTLDAYFTFDEILQEDQRLQLDNWSTTIALQTLEPEEVIEIINKYLMNFWEQFEDSPPPAKSLFPFGMNSIKYLYENHAQDLRRTLKFLYTLIEKYRKNRKLEYIDNFFKAFRAFRQRNDLLLSYIEKKELKTLILNSPYHDEEKNALILRKLGEFFKILSSHPDYSFIKHVSVSPFGMSVEFLISEKSGETKKLGFLTNISATSSTMTKNAILRAHEFLKTHEVDYLTWLTTVKSQLDIDFGTSKNSHVHVLRKSPLTDLELAYLSFILFFEDIQERAPNIEEIEFILNKLDLSPLKLKIKLTEILPTEEDLNLEEMEVKQETRPVQAFEIGPEEIKTAVEKYLKEKATTYKKIISSTTIKEIKMRLNLDIHDTQWDEDIWNITMDLSKDMCKKQTPKSIYF
ncbi:MAG: hypothetical protein ACTSU4_00105 [Promethearchaeota archaeon]